MVKVITFKDIANICFDWTPGQEKNKRIVVRIGITGDDTTACNISRAQIHTLWNNDPTSHPGTTYGIQDDKRWGGVGDVRVETRQGCVVVRVVFEFIDCTLLLLINIVEVDGLRSDGSTMN